MQWRDAALNAASNGLNWKHTSTVSELFGKSFIQTSELSEKSGKNLGRDDFVSKPRFEPGT